MISIIVALAFIVIAFTKFQIVIAIFSAIVFLGFAIILNFLLRPKTLEYRFCKEDYILQDTFKLYELEEGIFAKEILSKTGKNLILFKSEGKDKNIDIRRLPRENMRLIYDNENAIKIFVAKKKVYGNILYSVFPAKFIDLGAEFHSEDDICRKYNEKEYHN